MLLVAAVIHLLPLIGILGAERLGNLYGISFAENNIEILMRHRAGLFGLLGAFLLYAAISGKVQFVALVAGTLSVVSFLAIAFSVGGYNTELTRVIVADVVALACLLAGFVFHGLQLARER